MIYLNSLEIILCLLLCCDVDGRPNNVKSTKQYDSVQHINGINGAHTQKKPLKIFW